MLISGVDTHRCVLPAVPSLTSSPHVEGVNLTLCFTEPAIFMWSCVDCIPGLSKRNQINLILDSSWSTQVTWLSPLCLLLTGEPTDRILPRHRQGGPHIIAAIIMYGRRKKPVQNPFFSRLVFFQDGFFRFLPWFFPPLGKNLRTLVCCLCVCMFAGLKVIFLRFVIFLSSWMRSIGSWYCQDFGRVYDVTKSVTYFVDFKWKLKSGASANQLSLPIMKLMRVRYTQL